MSNGITFGFAKPLAAALALAGALAAAPGAVSAPGFGYDGAWAPTWAASPEPPRVPPTVLNNQTVREVLRISIGAGRFRVRLTNEYGSKPVIIGAAHLALTTTGSGVDPRSDRALTFDGKPTVTIPAYGVIYSDPVDISGPALSQMSVSLYFPGTSGDATGHFFGLQTAYVGAGNQVDAREINITNTLGERPFVSGVEVALPKRPKVVVTLGDALTDGFGSQPGANHRWPDYLAQRLNEDRKRTPTAVVNASISGNRLLHDFIGPNAISRFDRDVLSMPRVSHLIILLGINDFGFPGARNLPDEEVTAEEVIAGYKQLVARARAHDIKVIGATLPPFGPIPSRPGFYSDEAEAKRQAVNQWIRTSGFFDGVIDFDAAVRDPKTPNRLNPGYDSGDHLNLNDAGYKAMADAVNLKLLD